MGHALFRSEILIGFGNLPSFIIRQIVTLESPITSHTCLTFISFVTILITLSFQETTRILVIERLGVSGQNFGVFCRIGVTTKPLACRSSIRRTVDGLRFASSARRLTTQSRPRVYTGRPVSTCICLARW